MNSKNVWKFQNVCDYEKWTQINFVLSRIWKMIVNSTNVCGYETIVHEFKKYSWIWKIYLNSRKFVDSKINSWIQEMFMNSKNAEGFKKNVHNF